MSPPPSAPSYTVPMTEADQPQPGSFASAVRARVMLPPDQVGAVPCRFRDGRLEILLVTSRTRGRWIVPKGNIEPGATRTETASAEAFEEGGVRGTVLPVPLGRYRHGRRAPLVEVYLLHVEAEAEQWAESHERVREWVPASAAVDRIDVPALRPVLRRAAAVFARLATDEPSPAGDSQPR